MAVKKTLQFFLQPLLKKFFQDMGRDPNNLEMILIRQKAGQQLKDSEKIIQFPQKRSFAEEIEAMKKSGDLADVNNLKKNDNVLRREMFRDSNLNKDKSIMGQIDERMNNINKASKRLDEIKKEIDEMYRPKTDAEIKAKLEKQNKDAVERMKKKKDDEPEDRATGGRAGFNTGGASNPNKRQGAVEEKTIDPRTSTQPDDNRPQSVNTTLPTGPAGIETIVTGEDDFDTKGFLSRVRKKKSRKIFRSFK
jgi:recombination DNA repair RAD52 pathway protein